MIPSIRRPHQGFHIGVCGIVFPVDITSRGFIRFHGKRYVFPINVAGRQRIGYFGGKFIAAGIDYREFDDRRNGIFNAINPLAADI